MSHKYRIGANIVLRQPALNRRHHALLDLGKCLNALGGNRGISDIFFPRRIAFGEFLNDLTCPATHICIHQPWLLLYGQIPPIRDNFSSLHSPLQWTTDDSTDRQYGESFSQTSDLLASSIG